MSGSDFLKTGAANPLSKKWGSFGFSDLAATRADLGLGDAIDKLKSF
jgi:hypothetical protein